MAVILNASTSSGLVQTADTSGELVLQSNGTTRLTVNASGVTIPTLTTTTVTGTIVQGTAVASTSGTSIDFTGIPSWVKKITVMFVGVSTSGTSNIQIQIGDAGGIETTGYISASNSRTGETASTAGFIVTNVLTAGDLSDGACYISYFGVSNNYVSTGIVTSTITPRVAVSAGSKALSATLDRVRITTVNGTDTFDAGTINIQYEG
jgi:acyl CoA:acetate/3-ketoacid CoA transferase alpha subunit